MTRGLIADPFTLAEALASVSTIKPSDTLYLRGGTYTGDFISAINGSSGYPVTIKPYPGEVAIIDGSFTLNGSYVLLDGLHFTYSGWTKRTTDLSGSEPSDMPFSKSLTIQSPYSEVRHCVIYDMAGFGIWTPAIQAKIYGNVIYNIGWNSTVDRGHGHLFYTQNDAANGRKIYKHNVATASFSTGLKIYTEGGKASGFDVIGNTIFNSAVLYDGNDYGMNFWVQDPAGQDYKFERNRSYHTKATGDPVRIGLYDPAANVELISNYFPEGIVHDAGNGIVTDTGGYYGTAVGNQVFIEPDEYDTKRAIVTIYNEAEATTISVDLTSVTGLAASDSVKVHNAQDYFGDIQTLTLDANKVIVVDMQAVNRTVATPVQWTAPATTFPLFGCFVIEAG